jgi:hypothetical protein
MGPLAILAGLAAVGAVAGGVRAHNQDKPVWKGIGQGALLGGGLGLGAIGMGAGGGLSAFGGAAGTAVPGASGILSKLGGMFGGGGGALGGLVGGGGGGAAGGGGGGGLGILSKLGSLGGGMGFAPAPGEENMGLPGGAPEPTGDPGLDKILRGPTTFPGSGPSGGMGGFWSSLQDFLAGSGAESRRQEEIEQQLALINASRQGQGVSTGFTPGAVSQLLNPLATIGSFPVGARMLPGGLNF